MKKQTKPPKAKEYAAQPFAALKGMKSALVESPVPSPPPVLTPVEEDGDLLFLRAMAAVRPMQSSKNRPLGTPPAALPEQPAVLTAPEQQEFLAALRQLRLDVSFRDSLPGDADPKRPKTVDRLHQLKRGTIKLDYELDLHGLTRDEAMDSLAAFVASAVRRQQKAVLVIVGKGLNSPGEPVLQGAVAAWLRDHGRDLVAEFAPAPRDMGGDGAFVVFLKNLRGKP
jgi:DNA-nicking Smr family endonuclease